MVHSKSKQAKGEARAGDRNDRAKDHATMQYPAKQHLLRAARDDLPTLLKQDLTVESSSETAFADRLSDAELALGLK